MKHDVVCVRALRRAVSSDLPVVGFARIPRAVETEGFKANGYRTGLFGKWHNGEDPAAAEVQ